MSRRGRKSAAADDDLDIEEEDDVPKKKRVVKAKAEAPAKKTAKSASKRKPRKNSDDDDDEEEEAAASGKGKGKVFLRLPPAEQKMLVAEVVRLLLMKHREKQRVTQLDLRKLILKDEYQGMSLGTELVKQAGLVLNNVFGMELVQLEKIFFLRSAIPSDDPIALLGISNPSPLEGLAACIIGFLHTSKSMKLEETELFELASAVADFREGAEHPVFGKWKDVINSLVRMKYLVAKKEKDQHGEKTTFYVAGPRVSVEWDLARTEAMVSEVYGRPVDKEKLKELELERGVAPVPEESKRAPTTRAKKAASAAPKAKAPAAKKKKSKFVDSDEEDEGLFDDEDE